MSLKDFIVTAGVYVNINGLFHTWTISGQRRESCLEGQPPAESNIGTLSASSAA